MPISCGLIVGQGQSWAEFVCCPCAHTPEPNSRTMARKKIGQRTYWTYTQYDIQQHISPALQVQDDNIWNIQAAIVCVCMWDGSHVCVNVYRWTGLVRWRRCQPVPSLNPASGFQRLRVALAVVSRCHWAWLLLACWSSLVTLLVYEVQGVVCGVWA